jgi:hypothetical protein
VPWLGMGLCVIGRLGLAGRFACVLLFPLADARPYLCVLTPVLFLSTVPSASMTRLARSRTASLTSASSVDGSRPQACTHSESSEGLGQVNHTMEVSC